MMVSRQRVFPLVALLLALTLLLVACERPLQPGDGEDVAEEAGEVVDEVVDEVESVATEASDDAEVVVTEAVDEVEEVATEVVEETEEEPEEATPEPTETEAGDTPRPEEAEEEATPTAESATAEEDETADDEETVAEATEEEAEAADTEETEVEVAEEAEETAEEAEAARPTTHVVAPGENLYRIGLQYGLSWVALAEANDLDNPGRIRVGQELTIPSDDVSEVEPTPSPLTETTYVVQPGDNLFRIGLAYGISWVQIAEANGLVNPNHVVTGQVLKIPVDTPGPTPQFTHQVKPGETLFDISLQYGVPWPAIAEANDISSPYVIYSGQTLVIPGG